MIPRLWLRLMQEFFGCTGRMASRLWQAFDVTPLLLYRLNKCDEPGHVDHAVLLQRFDALCELIRPSALIAASMVISPENGRPRAREAVAFEERVLMRT